MDPCHDTKLEQSQSMIENRPKPPQTFLLIEYYVQRWAEYEFLFRVFFSSIPLFDGFLWLMQLCY